MHCNQTVYSNFPIGVFLGQIQHRVSKAYFAVWFSPPPCFFSWQVVMVKRLHNPWWFLPGGKQEPRPGRAGESARALTFTWFSRCPNNSAFSGPWWPQSFALYVSRNIKSLFTPVWHWPPIIKTTYPKMFQTGLVSFHMVHSFLFISSTGMNFVLLHPICLPISHVLHSYVFSQYSSSPRDQLFYWACDIIIYKWNNKHI